MLKSSVQSKILKTLPDDRPITAIQVVEDLTKCPRGFYPVSKTYDQDSDADLGEKSIFKSSTERYLCLSKTEGIPNFVLQELAIQNDKTVPPKGFSLLNRTVDTQQKAWKKKQICYKLVNKKDINSAITDVIVCSRIKRAPIGFLSAGEINGVIICYKMGNTESTQNEKTSIPASPNSNNVYPPLGSDDGYEILKTGYDPPMPSRLAPKPPVPPRVVPPQVTHQNSTHTLGNSSYPGLDGVPFVVNPKFLTGNQSNSGSATKIKTKTMNQILAEYNYSFTVERQVQ